MELQPDDIALPSQYKIKWYRCLFLRYGRVEKVSGSDWDAQLAQTAKKSVSSSDYEVLPHRNLDIKHKDVLSSSNSNSRIRNICQALPILISSIIFFLLPLDIWLPIYLKCSLPPTYLGAIQACLVLLTFTICSSFAFSTEPLAKFPPPVIVAWYVSAESALQAVTKFSSTTRFLHLLYYAGGVGYVNARFFQQTICDFSQCVHGLPSDNVVTPFSGLKRIVTYYLWDDGDPHASWREKSVRFSIFVVMKAHLSLSLLFQFFGPVELYEERLGPAKHEGIYMLCISMYLIQIIGQVVCQRFMKQWFGQLVCFVDDLGATSVYLVGEHGKDFFPAGITAGGGLVIFVGEAMYTALAVMVGVWMSWNTAFGVAR